MKIFANLISHKGIVLKIHKELLQFNNKKTNSLIYKCVKNLNGHFPQDIQTQEKKLNITAMEQGGIKAKTPKRAVAGHMQSIINSFDDYISQGMSSVLSSFPPRNHGGAGEMSKGPRCLVPAQLCDLEQVPNL